MSVGKVTLTDCCSRQFCDWSGSTGTNWQWQITVPFQVPLDLSLSYLFRTGRKAGPNPAEIHTLEKMNSYSGGEVCWLNEKSVIGLWHDQ